MQKHLVIFAKAPRIGRVKTRLAREIGSVAAWRFYRTMVQTITRRLQKGNWQTWLAISPDDTPHKCFNVSGVRFLPQGNGDLGKRMLRPAQSLPKGAFIVIGTDVPDIRPAHIRQAFKLLGANDIVFGPALDGGFWLVGHKRHPVMKNPYAKGVRWSHPRTMNDCVDNLKNDKVAYVETLSDIDCKMDLLRWRKNS